MKAPQIAHCSSNEQVDSDEISIINESPESIRSSQKSPPAASVMTSKETVSAMDPKDTASAMECEDTVSATDPKDTASAKAPSNNSLLLAIRRWGSNKSIKQFEKQFDVKDGAIHCRFKRIGSSICSKVFATTKDEKGFWRISNFTRHFKIHLAEDLSSRTDLEKFLHGNEITRIMVPLVILK
jgi:hypothetical protein